MQHLHNALQEKWQLYRITNSALLVIGCLLIWFFPLTHDLCLYVDTQAFALLNKSLLLSESWQFFWGYLNHPNETWLNVVFMIMLNIVGIFLVPKAQRPRAIALVVYFWLFFQFILLFTHKIFSDWLEVQRHSPSLVMQPWVNLAETLNNQSIKVSSQSSFPAGHVLVLVFWLKFTSLYCKNWLLTLAIVTTILLTLPRMFSGAHWLSDIIFTICYSLLWFSITISTPFYAKAINFLTRLFTRVRT